jgi:hypothetical protein
MGGDTSRFTLDEAIRLVRGHAPPTEAKTRLLAMLRGDRTSAGVAEWIVDGLARADIEVWLRERLIELIVGKVGHVF